MFDFGKMIRDFLGRKDDDEEKRRQWQENRESIRHSDSPLNQPKQFQGFDATRLSTIQQSHQQEQPNLSPGKPKTPMFQPNFVETTESQLEKAKKYAAMGDESAKKYIEQNQSKVQRQDNQPNFSINNQPQLQLPHPQQSSPFQQPAQQSPQMQQLGETIRRNNLNSENYHKRRDELSTLLNNTRGSWADERRLLDDAQRGVASDEQLKSTIEKMRGIQYRQKTADAALGEYGQSPMVNYGNRTPTQFLEDFNSMDAGKQREAIEQISKNLTDYAKVPHGFTNPEQRAKFERIIAESELLRNLIDDRAVKRGPNLETVGKDAVNIGRNIIDGIAQPFKAAYRSGEALVNHNPLDALTAEYKAGKLSEEEYARRYNAIDQEINGITGGMHDKGTLDRILRAAGTAVDVASSVAPVGSLAKGVVKGIAPTLTKSALEKGVISQAAEKTIPQLIAHEAATNAALGVGGSLRAGTDWKPEDALQEGLTGAALGAGMAGAGAAIGSGATKLRQAYVDGDLHIPRTEITPNAGRNERMRSAIENYPIDEPFNYGRVSQNTLDQHNAIQAQTGQDFVTSRDVTVYPGAHNAHVEKRVFQEGVAPEEYVNIAEKSIYGNSTLTRSPNDTGLQNVMYSNTDAPSGRVMMGQFNDGLSLKSVQKIRPERVEADIKKTQAKLGTPLMDDDLRGVTRAGSDLESATGTSPISNPSGTRTGSVSNNTLNVNGEDVYKPTKPGFFGTAPEDYRYRIEQTPRGKYAIVEEYADGSPSQRYSTHSDIAIARREAQRLAEGLEKPIQVEETGKGYNGFTERAAEIELKKLQTARPEYDWEIKPAEHMDSHDITRGKYGIKGVLRESDARLDGPNQPARTYEVEGTVPKVKEELDLGDGSKLTSTTNGDTGVTTTERVAPDNTADLQAVAAARNATDLADGYRIDDITSQSQTADTNPYPQATVDNVIDKLNAGTPAQRRLVRDEIRKQTGYDVHDIRGMKQYPTIVQSAYNRVVGSQEWIDASKKIHVKGTEANRKPDLTEFALAKGVDEQGKPIFDLVPLDGNKHTISSTGMVVDKDGKSVGSYVGIDENGNQHAYVEGKPVNLGAVVGDIERWGNRNNPLADIDRIIDANAPDAATAAATKEFTSVFKDSQEAAMKVELKSRRDGLTKLESKMLDNLPSRQLRKDLTEDMFDLVEKKVDVADLNAKYGKDYVDTYMKPAVDWWRTHADDILNNTNRVLEANGYDPIPRRKNYISHIMSDPSFFEKVGLKIKDITGMNGSVSGEVIPSGVRGGVPDEIVGNTENTGTRRKWNPFAQTRRGELANKDFFGAIDRYYEAMLYNQYMTPAASRVRVVENAFRTFQKAKEIKLDKAIEELGFNEAMAQVETGKPKHKNFKEGERSPLIAAWQEYGNILAGKTNAIDRLAVDKGFGRAVDVSIKAQGIVGANTIPGSATAAVAQVLSVPQTIARDGLPSFMKAVKQMVHSGLDEASDPLNRSSFMKARYTDASSQRRGIVRKYTNVASIPMEAIEKFTGELSWRSAYNEALSKGLTGDAAIKQADLATKATLAGRGIGDRPLAMNSKVLGVFTQFGLEINNMRLQFFKDFTPAQKAKFIIAAAAANYGLKMVTGQEPLPDFLKAMIETYKDFTNGEDDANDNFLGNTAQAGQRLLGEASKFVPGGPALAGVFIDDKTKKTIFGEDSDISRYGTPAVSKLIKAGLAAGEGLSSGDAGKIGTAMLDIVPTGTQIKRTIQGATALKDGYTQDSKGNIQTPVDRSPTNIVKGMLFGKNALDEQKQFYDTKQHALSDKDSAAFREMLSNNPEEAKQYYNLVQDSRKMDILEKRAKNGDTTAMDKLSKMSQATSSGGLPVALKAKIARGDYTQDGDGTIRTKGGEVAREVHKRLAKDSKDESDATYRNYVLGYGLKQRGSSETNSNTGNDVTDKLSALAARSNDKAIIHQAIDLNKNKKYADMPAWVKERYATENGIGKEQLTYATQASYKADVKLQYLKEATKDMSNEQLVNTLYAGRRKSIADKCFVEDSMLKSFYNDGRISKDQYQALRSLIMDENGNVTSRSRSGGGGSRRGSGDGSISNMSVPDYSVKIVKLSSPYGFAKDPNVSLGNVGSNKNIVTGIKAPSQFKISKSALPTPRVR
jgi:hypothetical protein|nr:MAG TPA: hypothetical protein [Bacteriophage sp.]